MLKEFEKIANDILKEYNLSLFSIKLKDEYGIKNIVEIIIDEETINQQLQEQIHLKILDAIDHIMPDDYYLELSSKGCEYPITSEEEIKKNIGEYIYIVSDFYKGYGFIEELVEDNLVISYLDKTRKKTVKIKYNKNIKIRKAVRL